jgi:hypothetical protein
MWKKWRGKCLSYLLDERTIRIVSGSDFIFSAPKEQWIEVFEPLLVSVDSSQSGLVEVMVSILRLPFNHLHYCITHYLHYHINICMHCLYRRYAC